MALVGLNAAADQLQIAREFAVLGDYDTARVYYQGVLTQVERYTGIASIVIDPPSTPERLQKNPLGLYVHSFTWSRDLQQ